MRRFVETELENLGLGADIARVCQALHLSPNELAALAGMKPSRISAIETSPKNVEFSTLIRIARAPGYQSRPEFVKLRRRERRLAHA